MSRPQIADLLTSVERLLASLAQPSVPGGERVSSPEPWIDLVWDPRDQWSIQRG